MPILYARFIWGLCLSGGQVVPCEIEGKDGRERVVSPIMLDKLVHNRWPRVGAALFGSLLLALAINLFIVPQHLYTSGLLGLCQVIRTLLDTKLGIRFSNFDLAGTLYLLANLPLLLAYKTMGRTFVVKLALCTVSNSLFLSIIPIPAEPIIPDMLTSCLVGGILAGFSNGLVLTCGASCGGLDILGLYLSKKGRGFTVGKFSLLFNAALYTLCLVLFSAPTAIYSAIYTVFNALFVDRVHQQNISVQMLIFTKEDPERLNQTILEKLDRSFTLWEGRGGYSHDQVHVLCVCLSKYEVVSVQMALSEIDPHAFTIIQEGIRVGGNFGRHLSS